ncbi:MAG: hypothetical protein IOMNBAOH_01338 [Rhodocyclaceae bacterium]|jgi:drug/metabolite transporter (DMT)-like permease|nr:hypothetical protein [Rhodocyclaceae bacterium]
MKVSPYLLLTLSSLFWSGNMIAGRILRGSPPAALTFWRWCVVLAILLPFVLPILRRQWPIVRTAWPLLLVLGLLGVGSFGLVTYIGLKTTTATNASLLNSIIPVTILALSWIFLRQPLSARQISGVLVSLAGVAAIVTRGELALLRDFHFNPGDLWILVAVVCWSIYSILLRYRPPTLHPLVLLVSTVSIGMLGMGPIFVFEHQRGDVLHLSTQVAIGIGFVALFPSLLAYLFWNRGVAEVGAEKAGLFLHLMPVFGTLLSVIFLDEVLHGYHAFGIGMIVVGIYLSTVVPARLVRSSG